MHKAEPQMQNLEMFNTKPHSRQYTSWLEWCLHVDYWIVFWHSFCCQDVKHISRGSKQLEAMKIPASLPRQLRLFPPPNLFIHMPSNNRMTMRMMMMMMMMMMNDDEWWWMMMNDDEWWMMNDEWWWMIMIVNFVWNTCTFMFWSFDVKMSVPNVSITGFL